MMVEGRIFEFLYGFQFSLTWVWETFQTDFDNVRDLKIRFRCSKVTLRPRYIIHRLCTPPDAVESVSLRPRCSSLLDPGVKCPFWPIGVEKCHFTPHNWAVVVMRMGRCHFVLSAGKLLYFNAVISWLVTLHLCLYVISEPEYFRQYKIFWGRRRRLWNLNEATPFYWNPWGIEERL